jgi:chromosomal replication initiator protein
VVCDYFGIKREQLLSKTRKREIALPRQLAMYFAKEFTNATFTKIGEEMGGKDHSTVMYAVKRSKMFQKSIRKLKNTLKNLPKESNTKIIKLNIRDEEYDLFFIFCLVLPN